MRGCVGLESMPAMEDEHIWCLDWHEEDLGCDRKTTVRSPISSGRMNFQVGESSGCWVGGWPGRMLSQLVFTGWASDTVWAVHTLTGDGQGAHHMDIHQLWR